MQENATVVRPKANVRVRHLRRSLFVIVFGKVVFFGLAPQLGMKTALRYLLLAIFDDSTVPIGM